ncbi:superfamily II DNA/RNA helicase [Flavobacterium nitrogenifigens]|uniref:Superfamily II DNA/RNA helicase n=2 Tax=Flavobacterium TaxID=237 RepID=A0A7W7IWH9_9FLAO|nr:MULTISPECIES: DEAD/DEAH box helicase [Flavobacterium]MBB4801802.1 superfamily II DNA/RNA helicase [Flavobacterium nitrogenifigens]MBB6386760.1 superfamily II DNA/RNA helicase [Flavobacterium notoginsengisoli]WDF58101.1 DEAD/DEAH box helicase [Flavobacterium sp. KACC 22758]
MYNSKTEEKIKDIPQIGDIDIERLPQELTRIYAQVVSLRRQITEGDVNLENDGLLNSLMLLQKLANNLETILISIPNHEQKESIAFVAATANSLLYKITLSEDVKSGKILDADVISRYIASIILFLIGNSQADAAEMTNSLPESKILNLTQQRLVASIVELAKGRLSFISKASFSEKEISIDSDLEDIALNFLWRELGLGIVSIASSLTGKEILDHEVHFDNVIELSISEEAFLGQKSVFAGPYRLARLLKILGSDITGRGVINIPTPDGVDSGFWNKFLSKLAAQRPYLWENHKDAVATQFLQPGTSAVLTLPTGAGKSTLSELKIASTAYSGKKTIYLVPTHALEDQVKRNLKDLFEDYDPEDFEFDGEYTEFAEFNNFPFLVMTPERCLTIINLYPEIFHHVGLVVFDEFHLIHGTDIKKDRRSIDAMYCLLSLFTLIPHSDYLLISAMVENGQEICSWVEKITNRECLLFNSSWKPTRQLHGCIVFEESEISDLRNLCNEARYRGDTIGPSLGLKREMKIMPYCFFSLKNIWETTADSDYLRTSIINSKVALDINKKWQLTSNRNEVASKLAIHFARLGLKTLVFVDDPKIANSTWKKINNNLDRENSFTDFCKEKDKEIELLAKELGAIEHSYFYMQYNVSVHHGLLLPAERNLIEEYYKIADGAVVMVATATLAQGINLPAEIVIIAGDDRFDDELGYREPVKPHDLLNAAGRAGRAGLSSQGAVILIPGDIVTMRDLVISSRWWDLKKRVFSKGDQCLKIEDPLEYLLDSLQDDAEALDVNQANILYRFKAEKLSEFDTRVLLRNSLYAFKAEKELKSESFESQIEKFLERRKQLDDLSEDVLWTKEVSFKTGVDPTLILQLSENIDEEDFEKFINYSISEFIDWFFKWLGKDEKFLGRIFTKPNTRDQIRKACGMQLSKVHSDKEILEKLPVVCEILKKYVEGKTIKEINDIIPDPKTPDKSLYLIKARSFILRLVPELSFSLGILSFITLEKAKQKKFKEHQIPPNIRVLASCIREGFDDADKLFFKQKYKFRGRVYCHELYSMF